MSDAIDYSLYKITSTRDFDDALSELKRISEHQEKYKNYINKIFIIIDEIIQKADMYEAEYARPLDVNKDVIHIHLDGRNSGNIILIYSVSGKDINLDLRLHNITNHNDLTYVSRKAYVDRQKLQEFNVVENKYSEEQIIYVEECYLDLITDYKIYQLKGQKKTDYSNEWLQFYFENTECSDPLTWDEFMEIIYYLQNKYQKKIFGSLDFNVKHHVLPISDKEERYIMNLFKIYDIDVHDAYIVTETDDHGDSYEDMFVETISEDERSLKFLESELFLLENKYEILFWSKRNGLGRCGKTYQFSHYFE